MKWAELANPDALGPDWAGRRPSALWAQSAATSIQMAQGNEGPAELSHGKVDHGPDGHTRPEVIRGDPEVSAVSGRSATPMPWWLAITSRTARVQ